MSYEYCCEYCIITIKMKKRKIEYFIFFGYTQLALFFKI